MNWLNGLVETLLGETKEGVIAGVGGVLLFWSVIQVLNNIEASFNDIWQIRKARSFMRKFSDYLAIMIVSPFAISFLMTFLGFLRKA